MNSIGIIGSNIISPLGNSSEANFEALVKGKSGLSSFSFPFSDSPICASLLDQSLLEIEFSSRIKSTKEFTRLEKTVLLSIQNILNKHPFDHKNKNTLLILATTKGNIDLLEKNNYTNIPMERVYLSAFAETIRNHFDFHHPCMVVSNACVSGVMAILWAQRLISNKEYSNVIVVGTDLISPFTLSGFKSFNALSPEPCRPFDKNRIGINLGEATASILISNKESEIKILAGSSANDANHISGPSRTAEGLFMSINKTFEQHKNIQPDFISAHGTATEFNDEMESIGFSKAEFQKIPTHSLKGYYGHTLGAAGVLETIIAIESLKNNILIPSRGFEIPGTSKELNIITKLEKKTLSTFLKTSSGFGGSNATLLIEKN